VALSVCLCVAVNPRSPRRLDSTDVTWLAPGACDGGAPLRLTNTSGAIGFGSEASPATDGATACAWEVPAAGANDVAWLYFSWMRLPNDGATGSCGVHYVDLVSPTADTRVCGMNLDDTPVLRVEGEEINVTFTSTDLPAGDGFELTYEVFSGAYYRSAVRALLCSCEPLCLRPSVRCARACVRACVRVCTVCS